MKTNFTVGSLYAGVGGICLGFIQSGFKLLWANEFDKNACTTYRKNFKHKLYEGDVMSLDVEKLEKVDKVDLSTNCSGRNTHRKYRIRRLGPDGHVFGAWQLIWVFLEVEIQHPKIRRMMAW